MRSRRPSTCSRAPGGRWTSVADAGAQRVSVGSRLTWVALAAMVAAAEEMRDEGSFAGLDARVDLGEWLGG